MRPGKANIHMRKQIHPYLKPKLTIHTNGSTYLYGIPSLAFAGLTPRKIEQSSYICLSGLPLETPTESALGPSHEIAKIGLSCASTNYIFESYGKSTTLADQAAGTSTASPVGRSTSNTAALRLHFWIEQNLVSVLDGDIHTNPL